MKTRSTLVLKVEVAMYFLLQNRLDLLMKEHLYSTTAVIITINEGMDDNVK